jgi:hypothetical protein
MAFGGFSLSPLTPQLQGSTSRRTSASKQANTHPLNGFGKRIKGQAITRDSLGL